MRFQRLPRNQFLANSDRPLKWTIFGNHPFADPSFVRASAQDKLQMILAEAPLILIQGRVTF